MNNIDIHIQVESTHKEIPPAKDLIEWTKTALEKPSAEITIRIVDEEESSHLNHTYRKKQGPTNVLSFTFQTPIDSMLHGDIVICAPLVTKEASEQNKVARNHWAHLTVHGVLHLEGYDHTEDDDAKIMEQQEIQILNQLGIPNPYE